MHPVHLLADLRRMVATMSKQQSNEQPVIGHPSTVAEIGEAEREIVALDLQLMEEAREVYEAWRKGGPPALPLSEHDRRVGKHLQKYMNGATPARLLEANVSRDAEIRAHRDALQIVLRDLARRKETASYAEAEKWVANNAKEWCALCREIVLAAERLAALEEGARRFLKPIEGIVIKMAMGSTIASGLSLLGTGDPLREMREAALKDSIVTEAEIRKAQKL
jgi:hypothetical protein